LGGEVRLGLALADQGSFQGPFESSGHEPVLRFDVVELAAGPLGFVTGSFDGELEGGDVAAVVGVGLGQGFGGGGQAGGFEDSEDLVEDPVLEAASPNALTAPFAAIKLFVPPADVAGGGAVGARVADLHQPPAPPAADPSL
jgi:hypothetical protein